MGVPSTGTIVDNRFNIYFGPLDYNIVKAQNVGLEKIMDFGWVGGLLVYEGMWVTRWLMLCCSCWAR